MRAVQYKGCILIRQESVWWGFQSKIRHVFEPVMPQLRSYFGAFCVVFAALALPSLGNAEPPVLELPIDCQVGSTCWLVNLPDRDPGPGRQDYRCGANTYNSHRGTDIAIANKRIMAAGVSVLASAPGKVIGIRDGMPETTRAELKTRTNIRGRECGNSVGILHADNWFTQYCHMKAGSLRVKRGDQVNTGDRLGDVGMSGFTEFPHVHVTVQNGDTPIDPFTGEALISLCNPSPSPSSKSLWSDQALKALEYPGPQAFNLGFAVGAVETKEMQSGTLTKRVFKHDVPTLVFWTEIFTLKKGDILTSSLIGPDGRLVKSQTLKMNRPRAYQYLRTGRSRPKNGWLPGVYVGRIEIVRNNVPIVLEGTATVE